MEKESVPKCAIEQFQAPLLGITPISFCGFACAQLQPICRSMTKNTRKTTENIVSM